jgi:hypothetical protein
MSRPSLGKRFRLGRPAVLALDVTSGVAAALMWKPGGTVTLALFEDSDAQWRSCGGGSAADNRRKQVLGCRPSAADGGPAAILTLLSSVSARRRRQGSAPASAVVGEHLRVASEVSFIEADGRRIDAPRHGNIVLAWEAPAGPESSVRRGRRPSIVAFGSDGQVLTTLSPGAAIDSAVIMGVSRS